MHACKGCGKQFKRLAHAQRHEMYHNPNHEKRKFRCDQCKKSFCTKQDLARHMRSVHNEDTMYSCSKCLFQTTSESAIARHEEQHDIVSGQYLCAPCDKTFGRELTFKNHLRDKHKITTKDLMLEDIPGVEKSHIVPEGVEMPEVLTDDLTARMDVLYTYKNHKSTTVS